MFTSAILEFGSNLGVFGFGNSSVCMFQFMGRFSFTFFKICQLKVYGLRLALGMGIIRREGRRGFGPPGF